MSEVEQQATIDPPRAIRVKTSTGWADLAIQGPTGARGTDGAPGATGAQGPAGSTGPPGPGVPAGGAAGTILTKISASDFASAWQAPAPQGADLVYNGDYPANTPYTDGDVVVYNGIAYLCVAPTSAAPTPWPGGPTIAPTPQPAYGTTLPASPIDGQEAVLVDSITNPSYAWRFRFNAGSTSPYKWECIGGSAVLVRVDAQEASASTSYVDLATIGPSFTVPRAGDYEVQFGTRIDPGATAIGLVSVKPGTAATPEADSICGTGNGAHNPSRVLRLIGLAAAAIVKMQYRCTDGTNVNYMRRWLTISPVRVS